MHCNKNPSTTTICKIFWGDRSSRIVVPRYNLSYTHVQRQTGKVFADIHRNILNSQSECTGGRSRISTTRISWYTQPGWASYTCNWKTTLKQPLITRMHLVQRHFFSATNNCHWLPEQYWNALPLQRNGVEIRWAVGVVHHWIIHSWIHWKTDAIQGYPFTCRYFF